MKCMAQVASLLPLSEELYLRALTGKLVGEYLFEGYSRIAVLVYPDRICSAIGSSVVTAYLSKTGYREGAARIYTYDDERLEAVVEEILKFDPEVLYIAYGGEQKLSRVNEATIKTLKALKAKGFNKALAIHVRTWLATKQFTTVLADSELLQWLKTLPEIRLFTADVPNLKFYFNKVKIEDGKVTLVKYAEASLTREHADLLKRSIPPPE